MPLRIIAATGVLTMLGSFLLAMEVVFEKYFFHDTQSGALKANTQKMRDNGGEGNDNITLNASTNLEVTGGAGADTININSDNNTNISSGAGNDVIKVNGAHNNINTGEGNNSITVNKDQTQLYIEEAQKYGIKVLPPELLHLILHL